VPTTCPYPKPAQSSPYPPRIGPQQAQHIYSTHKIQLTKNIYITACWIRLGVNPLRTSEQTDNNPIFSPHRIKPNITFISECVHAHARRKTSLEIHFIYSGDKDMYFQDMLYNLCFISHKNAIYIISLPFCPNNTHGLHMACTKI